MKKKKTKFSIGEKVCFYNGDYEDLKLFYGKVHQIISIEKENFYNILYNNGFIDKLIFLQEDDVHKCK